MITNINKTELIASLKESEKQVGNVLRNTGFTLSAFEFASRALNNVSDAVDFDQLTLNEAKKLLEEWQSTMYLSADLIDGMTDQIYKDNTWFKSLRSALKNTISDLESGNDCND